MTEKNREKQDRAVQAAAREFDVTVEERPGSGLLVATAAPRSRERVGLDEFLPALATLGLFPVAVVELPRDEPESSAPDRRRIIPRHGRDHGRYRRHRG